MTTPNDQVLSYKSRISNNMNRASNVFFVVGFLVKRLELIPHPLIKSLMHLIYSSCYLLAYLLFSIASIIFPRHTASKQSWYDHLRVQDQMSIAGLLGIVGSALILASFYCAPLLCVGLALMVVSNFAWFCGEVHRLNNPSKHEHSNEDSQTNYVYYAACVLAISVLALLPEICKLAALSAVGGMTVMCSIIVIALAIVASVFWLKSISNSSSSEKPLAKAGQIAEPELAPKEQTRPEPSFEYGSLMTPSRPTTSADIAVVPAAINSLI